ncbi:nitrogenase iron-molybdenum cofactor biosynthesis protein NifE [Pontiella agarivorans]|uniref:Nitrogenase iron-molybdenum cofactor biosynthesis protein NifE n=1 Tax=Pontiella agarivorans TaxID=3038953 RepID=A0ABU5MZH4_9BACT|nr:nitrogenase iron-molybdenum cofactor biosynthesis protein NifE [Pontiella agarivorans]MDZ8119366.1 nitrogenase iron-molybdenum cofactor biosynthesis protein NifE [Pontiella agarivorans]
MAEEKINLLEKRKAQVHEGGEFAMEAEKQSLAGSVSQRSCSFCGSRVVLYPIADAIHIVHGPIGCASYTWDIRGALSSGPELHRLSFSTDMQEKDVIYGGEGKLYNAISELIDEYKPSAAFIYSTCIIGVIGDDVDAICKKVQNEKGIPVIPVDSEGFKGSKKEGYKAACDALFKIVGEDDPDAQKVPKSINILGDFNLAGEIWIIKDYYERMGVKVVSTVSGDGRVDEIRKAGRAHLNIVQCSGSVSNLAKMLETEYGTPMMRASYFGIEDMSKALYDVADFFDDDEMRMGAQRVIKEEVAKLMPQLAPYRKDLTGKKAAVYTGGAFKVFSLVRSLRTLGMDVVVAGSQTGSVDDYKLLTELCDPGTVILDDTNPLELAKYVKEKDVDLFIGGVKERPIAYKIGVGFCDHNHERKEALAGFIGMLNFAKEVHSSVMSPVWQFAPRRAGKRT